MGLGVVGFLRDFFVKKHSGGLFLGALMYFDRIYLFHKAPRISVLCSKKGIVWLKFYNVKRWGVGAPSMISVHLTPVHKKHNSNFSILLSYSP